MANYYHEARAQARKLKEIQESNQRRSERRAEVAGANVSLRPHPGVGKPAHAVGCLLQGLASSP